METKKFKIVLMTKNERYLIKPWIEYHGELFGYENLHILDDSDDVNVLNYYNSIKHLPITIYNNNSDLNNLENWINKIMNLIKNDCDFMIKMDTDEFIGLYEKEKNEILIDKKKITDYINKLEVNGNYYKCSYTIDSLPLDSRNNTLEYTIFTQPRYTQFKSFFPVKTFEHCDLGCHGESYHISNQTDLTIIHYHNQSFYNYVENCKKAIISHKYIDNKMNNEEKISILQKSVSERWASCHKAKVYLEYLINPNYEKEYYDNFNNVPNKYEFDKLNKLLKNNKCIIITTINEPSEQILHYTNIIGWDLIIVGDSKTNNLSYKNINCIYLGLDEQKNLFPSIYEKIPLKSYTRKMFGYLYAIKNKYKVIYDTDDDNKYIGDINLFDNEIFTHYNSIDFWGNDVENVFISSFNEKNINEAKNKVTSKTNHFTLNKENNQLFLKYINEIDKNIEFSPNSKCVSGIFKEEKTSSFEGFVNLYKIYTDSNIWPRGIPPNNIATQIEPNLSDKKVDMKCVVIQGLVNNDPDVDAHYRININNNSFYFNKNRNYNIILDKYSVCPFNTQNTFWTDSSTFYAMYLPVSVTFRYTDILRGFIALYQLWKNNKTIKFTFPSAEQKRNEHDLNKDYESEIPMYNTAEQVINLLNENKDASIQEVYTILKDNKIVDERELDVLNEWLSLIDSYTFE